MLVLPPINYLRMRSNTAASVFSHSTFTPATITLSPNKQNANLKKTSDNTQPQNSLTQFNLVIIMYSRRNMCEADKGL